jgi:biopolymer transport protein ExbD
MPLKFPAVVDAGINMTPMIDIVFQLILFFLFNLRFKSLDYRIESQLPKDRGIVATNQIVDPIPAIKVSLFREFEDDPSKAYTKIKIAGTEYKLDNYQWTGNRKTDMGIEDKRDLKFAGIQAKIAELIKASPTLKGEIDTPPPKGASVPHSDIMRVLDCFLGAGIVDVNFVGAAAPLPKLKGGHGP